MNRAKRRHLIACVEYVLEAPWRRIELVLERTEASLRELPPIKLRSFGPSDFFGGPL